MNLKEEIERIQSSIEILLNGSLRLQDRINSLEVKIGNTNVEATLDSDAKRISNLQENIGTIIKKVAALEDFQNTVENWMRRIESILEKEALSE